MRTTVIPAQITTVEDKIAGSIGFTQLLLLITPVFLGSALFVILPPFFAYATYKLVVIVCVAAICGVLAIRVRGRILLLWLITLLRYNLRARYYVIDKNDTYLREDEATQQALVSEEITQQKPTKARAVPRLSTAEVIEAEGILTNPAAKARYEVTKRGELRVHLTEVAQ